MYSTVAWGKTAANSCFRQIQIERNVAAECDVSLDVKFCGICHTDVHFANNDLGITKYPCVPGHEIAGVVTRVGPGVTRCRVGDRVGVGCIVDTCMTCEMCDRGREPMCHGEFTMGYNYETKHGHIKTNTGWTLGGYSGSITVNER